MGVALPVRLAVAVALLTLSVPAATAATPYTPQLHLTAADQRLASLIAIQKSDLPKLSAGWAGGKVEPVTEGDPCLGARQSDLVLTGVSSRSVRTGNDLILGSTVWVLQNSEMVKLDQLRQPPTSVRLACARKVFADAPAPVRLVSVTKLPFPRIGASTSAARVVYDYTAKGETTRLIRDYVDISNGRVEASLTVQTAYSVRDAARTLEISLARLMAVRATPSKIIGYSYSNETMSATAGAAYTFGGLTLKLDKVLGLENTGSISIRLSPDTMTCTATLAGKPLPATAKNGCRWLIPADATGGRLVVTAHVTLMGAEKTIILPVPVS